MTERAVVVANALGLHARAAAKFVRLASSFDANISVKVDDGRRMDGKSIMGLLLLAASQGTRITVVAEGRDEQRAVTALCALVDDGFPDPS
ncbi:MAG: HPr family phosphocarrier protein [Vicinamibacterales bacterium]